MGNPIASPLDPYYQGKGQRPTDTELGKTKTTPEQDKLIESFMQLKKAKARKNKKYPSVRPTPHNVG